jgi:hypothetical protein
MFEMVVYFGAIQVQSKRHGYEIVPVSFPPISVSHSLLFVRYEGATRVKIVKKQPALLTHLREVGDHFSANLPYKLRANCHKSHIPHFQYYKNQLWLFFTAQSILVLHQFALFPATPLPHINSFLVSDILGPSNAESLLPEDPSARVESSWAAVKISSAPRHPFCTIIMTIFRITNITVFQFGSGVQNPTSCCWNESI